jgi:protein-disulfide isomerase-like protein with CxxC motif
MKEIKMSNAIYKPEVVIPTLRLILREQNAAERIADLIIQIQKAAYNKGRSEVACKVLNSLYQLEAIPTQRITN